MDWYAVVLTVNQLGSFVFYIVFCTLFYPVHILTRFHSPIAHKLGGHLVLCFMKWSLVVLHLLQVRPLIDPTMLTADAEGSSATTDIGEKLEKLKAVYHKIVTHGTFLPDSVLEPSVEDLLRRLLALHPSVCSPAHPLS